MTNEEVVRAYLAAYDAGDMETARSLLADDFTMVPAGQTEPVGVDAYIDAHRDVAEAFPDLRRHVVSLTADGDTVHTTVYVTATHDHHVRIPLLGIKDLPPTGRALRTRPHRDTFTIRDGRITAVQSSFPPGSGLRGLIDQLMTPEAG